MTIKVKYENGVLRPLEKVELEKEKTYEIEIKEERLVKTFKASDLRGIRGIMSCGGNAVEDSEKYYE